MIRAKRPGGALARAALAGVALLAAAAHAEQFAFVALGDTAYNPPADYPVYQALIDRINAEKPAFSVHVGDTWGAMPCTKANHQNIFGWFSKYQQPVVYTPGDNEWADCRTPEVLEAYLRWVRGQAKPEDLQLLGKLQSVDGGMASAGYDDPIGSLSLIRKVFFAKPESLGAHPMPVVRQPDVSDTFKDTVENVRWDKSGVVFATVDVPGSNNGFLIANESRAAEAIARNRANVDWIENTFARAKAIDAKAVVIALQAGMFADRPGGDFTGKAVNGGPDGPYHWIVQAIRDLGAAFGKPVLLINGDYHDFIVDRPFRVSRGESKAPLYGNIVRLQVYGAPELKAVKVGVDTDTPWVFSFQPLYSE